jgi:hypothetical protein
MSRTAGFHSGLPAWWPNLRIWPKPDLGMIGVHERQSRGS